MIVYSGSKEQFFYDVKKHVIAKRIHNLFEELGVNKESESEFRSWINSLSQMVFVLEDKRVDDDVEVAIEYQIPLTSKRVDFMIAGEKDNQENIVVIELKQWTACTATSREYVVKAFTGNAEREVPHPSQQVYSYAQLIQNFNESIIENKIKLIPCAYLHNYSEDKKDQIYNKSYLPMVKLAPLFLEEDVEKLQDFIASKIHTKSSKNLFEIIEHGKLKPSRSLQDAVGSILNGNGEFQMIDEQQVAYATILKLVENTIRDSEKHTVIVQGGPGTGKSVIAINLLAKILNNGFSCGYVTKNSAPRATFSNNLVKGKYTLSYLKSLFMGSGSFYRAPFNAFDCLLVDEAHRLNEKSGLFANKGENQIKEIINASKISVFFIDEDQVVTTKDIGSVKEIEYWARLLGSKVHKSDSLILQSQFRCNGSDGYLAFLDNTLGIRETANYSLDGLDYDIKIFDSPTKMREELRKKNTNNKVRMIAGYCYPWASQKDKTQIDIVLEDGFKAQWNFTTDKFAIEEDSFEQVGCIHSTQGLEFDYAGIIIGNDLRYENGRVITDYTKRAPSDASLKGIKTNKNYELADKIIRNTYKTLLSRSQKGCYVYCEDKALSKYLKKKIGQKENY